MEITLWKRAAMAVLVAVALAGCAGKGREGPVFATAQAVAAPKPDEFAFKHSIRVTALEALDKTVQRNLVTVLRAEDFATSLQQSLANDQMLAPDPSQALYELTPIFVDLRTAPVSDRITAAQAVIQYRVRRTDNGAVIFNRRIKADFSSVADSSFEDKRGMFDSTLRLVGLGKPPPRPVTEFTPGEDETRAYGPENGTAREVHASRSAIALNIRKAMRQLIVASPKRIVLQKESAEPAEGEMPDDGTAPEPSGAEETPDDKTAAEPSETPEPSEPSEPGDLPLAPAIDDSGSGPAETDETGE